MLPVLDLARGSLWKRKFKNSEKPPCPGSGRAVCRCFAVFSYVHCTGITWKYYAHYTGTAWDPYVHYTGDAGTLRLEVLIRVVQVVVGERQEGDVEQDQRDVIRHMEEVEELRDKERDAENDRQDGLFPGEQQSDDPGKDMETVPGIGEDQEQQCIFGVAWDLLGGAHQQRGGDRYADAVKELDGAGDAQMLGSASHNALPFLNAGQNKSIDGCIERQPPTPGWGQ